MVSIHYPYPSGQTREKCMNKYGINTYALKAERALLNAITIMLTFGPVNAQRCLRCICLLVPHRRPLIKAQKCTAHAWGSPRVDRNYQFAVCGCCPCHTTFWSSPQTWLMQSFHHMGESRPRSTRPSLTRIVGGSHPLRHTLLGFLPPPASVTG